MPLTDAKIRNRSPSDKPVKLTDAGGLYLEIRPSGSKLWRYRYRIAGRENVYAIGEFCLAPRASPTPRPSTARHRGGSRLRKPGKSASDAEDW
jgi:hypothetical protein